MSSPFDRLVVLVDMDCFYVQVEQRRDPSLKGKPCAVVQYKKYQGGGIIAVGYEARAEGVTRGMWGDEAKEKCPDIHLCRVPEAHGKANLDRYREAGAEVINVLSQCGGRVERASIDEAYIDLTEVVNKIIQEQKANDYLSPERLSNTHIVGWPATTEEDEDKALNRLKGVRSWLTQISPTETFNNDVKLAIAGVITEDIREAVYHQTGFRCSAGISHNKMLSKLACGINKPNQQTILPQSSVSLLFDTLKVRKIRHLGGKLGKTLVANFGIEFIGQVGDIAIEELVAAFGHKSAYWLHEVCKGIDHEPVKERHIAQSIGCGKNFLGPDALNTKEKVKKWMDSLIIELSERLAKDKAANNRVAKTLTVQVKLETGQSLSRSGPLLKYNRDDLVTQCLALIRALDTRPPDDIRWTPAIISMSVNAKNFDARDNLDSILQHTEPLKLKPQETKKDSPKVITSFRASQSACRLSSLFFKGHTKVGGVNSNENMDVGIAEVKDDKTAESVKSEKHGQIESKPNPHAAKMEEDVMFVDSKMTLKKNENSFFESRKSSNKTKPEKPPCMIDQMFLREKSLSSTPVKLERAPEGPIVHPQYGKIDMYVFEKLPEEIKQEILRSHRISSSLIPDLQVIKRSPKVSKNTSSAKNQSLILNFIPKTPTSDPPALKENDSAMKQVIRSKRRNLEEISNPSKRVKTRKNSGGNAKAKEIAFSSHTKHDIVPLGFFRQRSKLSTAIGEALKKSDQTNSKTDRFSQVG